MKVGYEMETSPLRRYNFDVLGLLILDCESAVIQHQLEKLG